MRAERRKDKIQELVCQSYEKFIRDTAADKEIKKQEYKCFITQRAKQVDQRSICKKGYGGTSTIDALSFYRRRPDVDTEIVEYDDWMTAKPGTRSCRRTDLISDRLSKIGNKLSPLKRRPFSHLMQGYKAKEIAEILQLTYQTVKQIIKKLKEKFLEYFRPEVLAFP